MASNDAAQRESYRATVKKFMIPPSASQIPIIDSHIHLYPASETHTLAWLSPETPKELQGQHSVEDYLVATEAPSSLRGFIFLETDRIHDLATGLADGSGYKDPLAEVSFLSRVALGTPREGEGHTAAHAPLCLAIIPWAPFPSGPSALEEYIGLVKSAAGKAFSKIKGFRYLVQDKPKDTMLGDGFIEGLQYLGKKGYVFDLGVDSHNGGQWQLEQAVEMIGRAHDGVSEEEKVGIVINHLCKPDLTLSGDVTTDPKFIAWRESIFQLSLYSKTYMKLSGMLSELPPELKNASGDEIFGAIVPWLIVILTAFKPHRIMFGSDWPVCEANIGGEAWTKWAWIVERFCDVAGLGDVEKGMVWGGTASKAYGIYGDVAEEKSEEEEEDEDDEDEDDDEEGEDEDESEEEQKIPAARGTAARLRAASKAMP